MLTVDDVSTELKTSSIFVCIDSWIIVIVYPTMPTCKKCQTKFSNRIEINGKIHMLNKRKFCLVCSPFGKHNTKRLDNKSLVVHGEKKCPKCNVVKPFTEFYLRRSGTHFSVYCKSCTKQFSLDRQRELKKKCVIYKGGKCQQCGYSRCMAALEFHHCDPSKKDFTISALKHTVFDESLKDELDKCRLLCSNCHKEEHYVVSTRSPRSLRTS